MDLSVVIIFMLIASVVSLLFLLYREIKIIRAIKINEARKESVQKSRSSVEGKVFENLAPYLPQWKYGNPSDAKFIGAPIDFLIFKGMSEGNPTEIIIVEVKRGKSYTTPLQNKIKKLVKEGKVSWETLQL